jgi:glycerophosphoryl diester phosphodiesterase
MISYTFCGAVLFAVLSFKITTGNFLGFKLTNLSHFNNVGNEMAIIAHRGASGHMPEHSLAGYRLAIDLGADYIEPDLQLTKDGVLVVMHDATLEATTDVDDYPEFADRVSTRFIPGQLREYTGKWLSDFTLEELKRLRIKQKYEIRSQALNGLYQVPTFAEVLALVKGVKNVTGTGTGPDVGICAELKHPAYFRNLGHDMESIFIDTLVKGGYEVRGKRVLAKRDLKSGVTPIVIQSFERGSLKILATMTDIPLVQLIEDEAEVLFNGNSTDTRIDVLNEDVLKDISSYAQGVGLHKPALYDRYLGDAKKLVGAARQNHLAVFVYTFRQDMGLSPLFGSDPHVELQYLACCVSIDGLFTEHPNMVREELAQLNVGVGLPQLASWYLRGGGEGDGDYFQSHYQQCPIDCAAYDKEPRVLDPLKLMPSFGFVVSE